MFIVLSGKAMAGKDTLGSYLQKYLKEDHHLVAYSTYLKYFCSKRFGLTREQLYGGLKEVPDKNHPKKSGDGYWTPREIMQFVGTEVFRKKDDDFWVKKLFEFVDRNKLKNIIITDGRFENEIRPVKERNGIHIRIDRNHSEFVNGENHTSETSLDVYEADIYVHNYGTLEDLEELSKKIVKEIETNGKKTKGIHFKA